MFERVGNGNSTPQRVGGERGAVDKGNGGTRNLRDVWTIATQPYPEAHFATFPERLPEICILAGSPEKVCAVCGAPWVRIVEPTMKIERGETYNGKQVGQDSQFSHKRLQMAVKAARAAGLPHDNSTIPKTDLGFRPTCSCNGATKRGVVLDIYAGSGTTCAVARRLGRDFIGIELNRDYIALAEKRINSVQEKLF